MGSAKRTAVLFALAWCLLFSLHSRVTSGLYPGAIQNGWKALLALALSPLLLRLLGDYALQGPVLAGAHPLALQRRGARAQRRGKCAPTARATSPTTLGGTSHAAPRRALQ